MTSRYITIRRADISLNNFNAVAIPHLVDLLRKHKDNITRFQASGDYARVKSEQINATRVVIQLKNLMEEMELMRQQIIETDLTKFDEKTEKSRNLTNQAINEYMVMTNVDENTISSSLSSGYSSHSLTAHNRDVAAEDSNYSHDNIEEFSLEIDQLQLTSDEIKRKEDCLKSWEVLQDEIQDLHELFVKFEGVVKEQAEPVNIVEQNIETASENVQSGVSFLRKAERFKTAWYPLAGAAIGCCVAGPIGLITGLKIGGLAIISGTALGFTGGKILKKNKECNLSPTGSVIVVDNSTDKKNT